MNSEQRDRPVAALEYLGASSLASFNVHLDNSTNSSLQRVPEINTHSNTQKKRKRNRENLQFVLGKDVVAVGRSKKNCDLVFDIPGTNWKKLLSRIHAIFSLNCGTEVWRVKDLGSMNGTFVNDVKIKSNVDVELSSNDIVRFGPLLGDPEVNKLCFRFVIYKKDDEESKRKKAFSENVLQMVDSLKETLSTEDGRGFLREHPSLLPFLHPGLKQEDQLEKSCHCSHSPSDVLEKIKKEFVCAICCEVFVYAHTLTCGHSFCSLCINKWLSSSLTCPLCRKVIVHPPVPSHSLDEGVLALVKGSRKEESTPETKPGDHISDLQETFENRIKAYEKSQETSEQRKIKLMGLLRKASSLGFSLVHISKPWSDREQMRFLQGINIYSGSARRVYCKSVGLEREMVGKASSLVLATVCENLRILPVEGNFVVDKEEELDYSSWVQAEMEIVRRRLCMFILYC